MAQLCCREHETTKRIKTNVATLNIVLVEDSCVVTLSLCCWIDWMEGKVKVRVRNLRGRRGVVELGFQRLLR